MYILYLRWPISEKDPDLAYSKILVTKELYLQLKKKKKNKDETKEGISDTKNITAKSYCEKFLEKCCGLKPD